MLDSTIYRQSKSNLCEDSYHNLLASDYLWKNSNRVLSNQSSSDLKREKLSVDTFYLTNLGDSNLENCPTDDLFDYRFDNDVDCLNIIKNSLTKFQKSQSNVSIWHIKNIFNSEVIESLPSEVQHKLICLMPECDRIVDSSNCDKMTLSATALNNEYFNRALTKVLLRMTSTTTATAATATATSTSTKPTCRVKSVKRKVRQTDSTNSIRVGNLSSVTVSNFEAKSEDSVADDIMIRNHMSPSSEIQSDQINADLKPPSIDAQSESELRQCLIDLLENSSRPEKRVKLSQSRLNVPPSSSANTITTTMTEAAAPTAAAPTAAVVGRPRGLEPPRRPRRTPSDCYLAASDSPTTIATKRPVRSTAGKLPARLMSLSPPAKPILQAPPSSGSSSSSSTTSNSSNSRHRPTSSNGGGTKSQPKKRLAATAIDTSSSSSSSTNSDWILLNLRNKLSKRLRDSRHEQDDSSLLVDHHSLQKQPSSFMQHYSSVTTANNVTGGAQSPRDSSGFTGSPPQSMLAAGVLGSSRSSDHCIYHNYKVNNSPQWSYTSEFTSQSSVESALNSRLDVDEMAVVGEVVELSGGGGGGDAEEMPPPRKTLTLAAMREKMRAKKMRARSVEGVRDVLGRDGAGESTGRRRLEEEEELPQKMQGDDEEDDDDDVERHDDVDLLMLAAAEEEDDRDEEDDDEEYRRLFLDADEDQEQDQRRDEGDEDDEEDVNVDDDDNKDTGEGEESEEVLNNNDGEDEEEEEEEMETRERQRQMMVGDTEDGAKQRFRTSNNRRSNNNNHGNVEELDSFLIDDSGIEDYQVDIDDDKMLHYSDEFDDLLLSGGSDTLLDIIMKDADSIDIGNESFSTLSSEDHQSFASSSSTSLLSQPVKSSLATVARGNSVFKPTTSNSSLIGTSTSVSSGTAMVTTAAVATAAASVISTASPATVARTPESVADKPLQPSTQQQKQASQPNAYLVDGNGLSDALKLIQSLNPGAKVTTQHFYLVNSGPQLLLCQNPPPGLSSSSSSTPTPTPTCTSVAKTTAALAPPPAPPAPRVGTPVTRPIRPPASPSAPAPFGPIRLQLTPTSNNNSSISNNNNISLISSPAAAAVPSPSPAAAAAASKLLLLYPKTSNPPQQAAPDQHQQQQPHQQQQQQHLILLPSPTRTPQPINNSTAATSTFQLISTPTQLWPTQLAHQPGKNNLVLLNPHFLNPSPSFSFNLNQHHQQQQQQQHQQQQQQPQQQTPSFLFSSPIKFTTPTNNNNNTQFLTINLAPQTATGAKCGDPTTNNNLIINNGHHHHLHQQLQHHHQNNIQHNHKIDSLFDSRKPNSNSSCSSSVSSSAVPNFFSPSPSIANSTISVSSKSPTTLDNCSITMTTTTSSTYEAVSPEPTPAAVTVGTVNDDPPEESHSRPRQDDPSPGLIAVSSTLSPSSRKLLQNSGDSVPVADDASAS